MQFFFNILMHTTKTHDAANASHYLPMSLTYNRGPHSASYWMMDHELSSLKALATL